MDQCTDTWSRYRSNNRHYSQCERNPKVCANFFYKKVWWVFKVPRGRTLNIRLTTSKKKKDRIRDAYHQSNRWQVNWSTLVISLHRHAADRIHTLMAMRRCWQCVQFPDGLKNMTKSPRCWTGFQSDHALLLLFFFLNGGQCVFPTMANMKNKAREWKQASVLNNATDCVAA